MRGILLSHTATDETGRVKIKTIGKMLDEKITLEGMVTIVLRTIVQDGRYLFATRNNGSDTTKAPMGLFESDTIDNDLLEVDKLITEYYQDDFTPIETVEEQTHESNWYKQSCADKEVKLYQAADFPKLIRYFIAHLSTAKLPEPLSQTA